MSARLVDWWRHDRPHGARPLREPGQAAAAGRVGPAGAVGGDREDEYPITFAYVDFDHAGVTVLGGVGQQLGLTRGKGSYKLFQKGLTAAHEAGLPLALSMIVTNHNAHEVDQMRSIDDGCSSPAGTEW